MKPIRLGVNVDHVATVRQQRRGLSPDPVQAALLAELAGADSIVCHLREDRRHIQDRDVVALRRHVRTRLNLEMGLAPGIVRAALKVRPDRVTLVPERRQELTTEGGLDVASQIPRIARAVERFRRKKIVVSLFVDPDLRQLEAARRAGAAGVEIHTGRYANARSRAAELRKVAEAARVARLLALEVAAGHGLDYENASAVAAIPEIEELNIGFSIVSRALFEGLERAVKRMKDVIDAARR
jgi:pyridoxine 5-phosphate synthase